MRADLPLRPPEEVVGEQAKKATVRRFREAIPHKARRNGAKLCFACISTMRLGRAMKNPTPATKKDSIVDTISAMEFCFICPKRLIFALLPLISAVLRAFFSFRNTKSAILCPGKTEVADFVSFKGLIVQRINLCNKYQYNNVHKFDYL
jgi:hypothetical protein